jgi:hypothetical protein
VCLLLQTFSQVIIVAEYYARKDYIAKTLCENRNKPQLHCEGKCCLKKKLAKEGKEQAPNSGNQKSEQTVNLIGPEAKIEIVFSQHIPPAKKYFSYNELKTYSYHHSVFHPPAV